MTPCLWSSGFMAALGWCFCPSSCSLLHASSSGRKFRSVITAFQTFSSISTRGTCMSSCYLFTANLITLLPLILCRTQPTLSTKQKRQLQEKLEYVQEVVKTKKVVCMCADRDALIRYQFADRSNHTKPKQRNLYGCQN